MSEYEESDEYCPHCDNHYVRPPPHFFLSLFSDRKGGAQRISAASQVLDAKIPQAVVGVEGEDARVDAR